MQFSKISVVAAALALTVLAGCTSNATNQTQSPNRVEPETLPVVSLAKLEDCDIVIGERVYKQTDFRIIERSNNHFSGTLLNGQTLSFELPATRNVNGIHEMVGKMFWTRNACLMEALKHMPNAQHLPAQTNQVSTQIEK